MQNDQLVDVPIPEGNIFMLPRGPSLSPEAGPGEHGMVIERIRPEGVKDSFEWYCATAEPKLGKKTLSSKALWTTFLFLKNIILKSPMVIAKIAALKIHKNLIIIYFSVPYDNTIR